MMTHARSAAPMPATSPWTEAYAMQFDRTVFSTFMQATSAAQEEQPTHDALVDVYNRETDTQPTGAFVYNQA
ncbi:hypothetical protein HC776_01560 [bacterium]|nr:hypothetical protein [bacterium]